MIKKLSDSRGMFGILKYFQKLNSKRGFSPILIVVAVALLAIPITTLLVQKQQDLRQRAATPYGAYAVISDGNQGRVFKCAGDLEDKDYAPIFTQRNNPRLIYYYYSDSTSKKIIGAYNQNNTCKTGELCFKEGNTAYCFDPNTSTPTPTTEEQPTSTSTQIHGVVTIGGSSEPVPQSMNIDISVSSPDDGKKFNFFVYDSSIAGKPAPYYSSSNADTPTSIAGKKGNYSYTVQIYNSGNLIGQGSGGGEITFGIDNTLNMLVNVTNGGSETPTPTLTPAPTKRTQPPASDSTPTPTGSSKPTDDTLPGSAICRGHGGLDKSKYVEPRCASSREDALAGGGKYDQAKARNGEFENKTYFDLYICAENSSLEARPAGEGNTICKTPPWTVKITPGQPTPTPELGVACLETNSTCEQNACSTLGKPRNPNGDQADKACERTNPNTGKAYGKYCCLKSGGNPGGETSTPTPTSGTCYQRCDYDGTCGGTLICINHCCSNGSRPQSKAGQGQTCEPGAIECEDWLKCIPTVPNPNVHVCVPNGNPTPTPTTNPGGACSSVERPDIGCPCNSGSCGFSGLACIMASGGAGGAGCCQNVGQRWCPPASGRQGTCVNYPYICPAGNSSPSNNTPTATPTPVPPTSSPGGSGACRECSGSSDCSGSNANRSDFCGTGSRCIFRSGPTGRAIGVCG